MSDNFIRYLHERAGISWISAHYHAFLIYEYGMACQEEKKNGKARRLLDFSYKIIDKIGHKMTMRQLPLFIRPFFPEWK